MNTDWEANRNAIKNLSLIEVHVSLHSHSGVRVMVKMIIMDGIVMGPTHCAFDNCTGPLSNARGHGESFCRVHKLNFEISVVCRIARTIELIALKPVSNTIMNDINIHSQEQHQVWLESIGC